MSMENPEVVEARILLDCPAVGCDTKVAQGDIVAQQQHMETCHPKLVIAIAAENDRLEGWIIDG